MAVSLYTSRVILRTLGVEDYGIYNLVAGFVTLFSFISNALVSAIQTLLNVALGRHDVERFSRVFSMSLTIMFLTSLLIIILGETVGLWFVNTQLLIPEPRQFAAGCVYHLSLISFVVNIIRSPYNAAIIANERMSFYAYVSIIEVVLRLGLVFSLVLLPFDKLITYATLYMALMAAMLLTYRGFCRKRLEGCFYHFEKDRSLFRELLSFSGWSLLGQSAVVAAGQGNSFFVNRFYSVTANAAMGVSTQLTGAIESFITNFQVAFNPQLVKSFTNKDKTEHCILLYRASRFSFFLQLLLTLPILFNITCVLHLWLGDPPKYSDLFCFFVLCGYLVASISVPLKTSIYASGRIRNYEIARALLFSLGLCGSFFVLRIGNPPYYVAVIGAIVQVLLLGIRAVFAKLHSGVSIVGFIRAVILPCVLVGGLSVLIPYLTACSDSDSFFKIVVVVFVDIVYIAIIICFVGLTKSERKRIIGVILHKFIKR